MWFTTRSEEKMDLKLKWIRWGSLAGISLLMICLMIWLNKPDESGHATAASKVNFVKAHVTDVLSDSASEDTWTEGLRLGLQEITLQIDSGAYKGREISTVNYLSAYSNVDLKMNSKIIVRLDVDEAGNPFVVSVVNHNRMTMIIGLLMAFVIALLVVGGKKGLSAIFGLVFTLFTIWFFLIPLIMRGIPAMPSVIFVVAITTYCTLVALNGFSKKTLIAVVGCIGGVTIAGLIAMVCGWITPINGFNMPEAEELVLRAAESGLKLSGLLVSGVLIASLGAVMDVALSIASAISELHEMNPKATASMLFKSGLNIGKDAMGTMANTLILAFAGASLNMLILFRVFDYPYMQIFNSDLMAIEIIQGISGSIGIVLTVPLVAGLGAVLYGAKPLMKQAK